MADLQWLIPIVINNLSNIFKDDFNKGLRDFYTKINLTHYLGQYRDRIIENYGFISLFGVNERVYFEDGFFVDTYFIREGDYEKVSENRIKSILKVDDLKKIDIKNFHQKQRGAYYILGDPGAGKSTILKYLAYSAGTGKIKKVPIFIDLSSFANPKQELVDFIAVEFEICGFKGASRIIEYLLENGNVLILFDGLDEVKKENLDGHNRHRVIEKLKNLYRKYPTENLFLVTCRHAANQERFERFDYLVIDDFQPENIQKYVRSWFKYKSQEKGESLIKELFYNSNKKILDLARNPLLLSLLCFIYNRNQSGGFSQRKVDIYEEAINILLHDWDEHKGTERDKLYKNLSTVGKKNLLAQIAYENVQNRSEHIRFPDRNVKESIKNYFSNRYPNDIEEIPLEEILKSIIAQHKMLRSYPNRLYSFAHLSFQEYFSALHYLGKVNDLLTKEHLTDDQWHEVILNVVSMLPTQSEKEFFTAFIKGINQIIQDEQELNAIFELASLKSYIVKSVRKASTVRLFYIILIMQEAIAIAIALSPDIEHIRSLDRERSQELIFAKNLATTFNLNPDLSFARDLDFDLSFTRDLDLDLAFDYQLFILRETLGNFYQGGSKLQNLENVQLMIKHLLRDTIEKGNQLGETEVAGQLEALTEKIKISTDDSHKKTLKIVDEALRLRGLKSDIEINPKQTALLNNYFRANLLLMKCLDSASGTDYQTTEDKMFLPLI